jgi:hypothetical protein
MAPGPERPDAAKGDQKIAGAMELRIQEPASLAFPDEQYADHESWGIRRNAPRRGGGVLISI